MCDTYIVMADAASTDSVMLGKNSDRPAFDSQPLAYHGRKTYSKGEKIQLAYVTIEQKEERYATVGASPYWCWGYELGYNEFGVAIGNEAIYTKDLTENAKLEKDGMRVEKGLLGMEILRLGLERGRTAQEALNAMTVLIEEYGQWGSGVPMADTVSGSYNNSFIIADKKEAWVLEAAGKRWAAKKIEKEFAAISNEVSIRKDSTFQSAELKDYAISRGWWPEDRRDSFDFAYAYIDFNHPLQLSHIRVQRIRQLLSRAIKETGKVSIGWMKRILRDHYEDTFLEGPYFNAALPDFLTICMHSSPAGFTWGNTASSSIIILPDDTHKLSIMWWAAGVPCCSVYIPVFVESGKLPECLTKAGAYGKIMCAPENVDREDTYKEGSFWWEMRSLLNEIKGDELGSKFNQRHQIVRELFDGLEEKWLREADKVERIAVTLKNAGEMEEMAEFLYKFTENCTEEALLTMKKARFIMQGKKDDEK